MSVGWATRLRAVCGDAAACLAVAQDDWASPRRQARAGRIERYARRAAQQGLIEAQVLLGDLYLSALLGTPDHARAFSAYIIAARAGFIDAQTAVAWLYRGGFGVPASLEKSTEWYEHAAQSGCRETQRYLADLFATGAPGMVPDAAKAKRYAALLAEGGG
jgi:uncharacterized protein